MGRDRSYRSGGEEAVGIHRSESIEKDAELGWPPIRQKVDEEQCNVDRASRRLKCADQSCGESGLPRATSLSRVSEVVR